jgi:hypothetical protein
VRTGRGFEQRTERGTSGVTEVQIPPGPSRESKILVCVEKLGEFFASQESLIPVDSQISDF